LNEGLASRLVPQTFGGSGMAHNSPARLRMLSAPNDRRAGANHETAARVPDDGRKICSAPALDAEFKTIDFLTLLDLDTRHPLAQMRFLN